MASREYGHRIRDEIYEDPILFAGYQREDPDSLFLAGANFVKSLPMREATRHDRAYKPHSVWHAKKAL